ncbi:NAD(P)H-hydrate dehydratase [Roseococcus sp. SYP-B2431]|uniref:NAD(P)H-hydrate dehydratase n=1 Tax=Roseococcus sp. SYP-B2431 TaxID=2496640 RepID=UPI00103E2B17|nr:NAD(P)H-hydrate dehydratase [Roseococcus sp. SYP-B2431]TCH98274.1 NAD(P)H-hydrate dehydratase [Roseococcus sp. SYP-B2431]
MSGATPVDEALLHGMPLPRHQDGEDKNQRGRVAVLGGSAEIPGAVLLAGVAALRAGAGKLLVATARSVAGPLAVALPEARVIGLAETAAGGLASEAAGTLAEQCGRCHALVLGPGMVDAEAVAALTAGLLQRMEGLRFVLDAAALYRLAECRAALRGHAGRVVLTPHAGEMAGLLGVPQAAVEADPLGAAREAASELQAVVAMKGGRTFIVTPQGQAWCCDRGHVGLATSGSGDTLAGIIGGLLARGAVPAEAAVWGVFLHGEAGARLARRLGRVGFLARELPGEIPRIMAGFDPPEEP